MNTYEQTWLVIGVLGVWCMEGSYIPQIARIHRLKHSADVSLFLPALSLVGRLMAFGYSYVIDESALAFGFVIGCVIRTVLLFQIAYYRTPPITDRITK